MSKKRDDGWVGTYELGIENVRLYLAEGDGGAHLGFVPNDGGPPKMTLYCSHSTWVECMSGLLHEAMEFCLHRRGAAYSKTHIGRESTADYLFVLSHQEFDQCCEFAARFLVACTGDLKKAWRAQKKDR